mmetsp:Transcript_71917/g.199585  ORF Transcript_71917/g.199585 Transcript_71917/m.199585 type:complete len:234 (-) Transcript_71917:569-1270(-)
MCKCPLFSRADNICALRSKSSAPVSTVTISRTSCSSRSLVSSYSSLPFLIGILLLLRVMPFLRLALRILLILLLLLLLTSHLRLLLLTLLGLVLRFSLIPFFRLLLLALSLLPRPPLPLNPLLADASCSSPCRPGPSNSSSLCRCSARPCSSRACSSSNNSRSCSSIRRCSSRYKVSSISLHRRRSCSLRSKRFRSSSSLRLNRFLSMRSKRFRASRSARRYVSCKCSNSKHS